MNWRSIGDIPQDAFNAVLAGTPLANEANDLYETAKGDTALLLAQLKIESDFGRSGLAAISNNPLGLRPRPVDRGPVVMGPFRKFASWAEAIRYWLEKIRDPTYAYAGTVTLEDYIAVYAPASDNNDEEAYAATIMTLLESWGVMTDLPDQVTAPSEEGPTMPLDLTLDLTTRMNTPLRDKQAFVTVHNTGNNMPREAERNFVNGGGGNEGVAYHFAVDETGATQIMPLWKRGVHAGNAEGNATSIAIEMCELREPWADVKENTAQLLAAIVLRDPRIRFDSPAYEFSLDRVREHRDWPGANPACPRRLIRTDGGVEKIVARARRIVAGVKPEPVTPDPVGDEGTSKASTRIKDGVEWVYSRRYVTPVRDVQTYRYADPASGNGPMLPKGKKVLAYYATSVIDPKTGKPVTYLTTRQGFRFRLSDALAT